MFKKQIPFLKRRGASQNDDEGATTATADVPSTETVKARRPSLPDQMLDLPPSPSRRSSANSIVRQFRDPTESSSGAVKVYGQDPLGLKVIHRLQQEHHVDIVFVHGLGGSSRTTWSKNRDLDYFWPLRFLSLEPVIKDEARILTFGYNSNFRPGSGKNKMSILDFAKELLFELKYAQDETVEEPEDLGMGQRPIVFVVHSMGGLIVKEAYMQGQIDPTFSDIIKSVSAIIFLSTPHRGTNLAETLNRILQVSFVANPMQFIAELATGSQTLQKLNEQFRHIAPKLEIVSFYETRPTAMLKKTQIMVLEKDSSVLGYPGEISKPLDADHHGVCKYESRDDPRYVTVRNVLKSLVRNAKPKDVQSTSKNETWLTSIEQFLGVAESPERDYNFFRDRWTAGTCTWILGDPGFVEWLHDTQDNPRILWIQGNAASGKSILSSFVIDHLIQNGRLCQYFFVRFEDKKKRSLSTMLRSLACQIARTLPTYAARIRQLEAAGSDLKSIDYRHIWQLMYKQSLFDLEASYPLYWVLDGIEEADNPQLLFNILSELHSIHTPLRILLVSRRTHEITTAAQKLSKQIDIRQISIDGNKDDFRRYVDREMDPVGEDSYREQVITEILRRAQGNFLWVHLAVQKINECQTRMEVEDALKELPTGMETLYHRMASTIKAQPEGQDPTLGQRILSWATYAQRPLSAEELSDALGIDGLLEIHRTIGQLCGGFVVVDHDGRVALIHETAREYLIRGQHEGVSLGLERKAANDKLFKRCITRLMDPTLRNLINRDRTPALLDYATSALFFHLSHGSPLNWEKLSDLLRFFQNQHVLTWIHVAAKGKKLRSLVVASRYLNEIVLKLRNMNEQESLLHRQVIEVLTGWAADLVKLVGKFGASLLKKPDAIYKLVPPFCPENSIIYQQFGKNEVKALRVSGITRSSWDDCLARLSLEQGVMASAVHHAGGRIVVLANRQNSGRIFIYNSTTFEEERRILHPERVFKIQADSIGEHLVSYGYRSTRVWTMSNGECIKTVDNPRKRPRPQSVLYVEKTREVLVAGEDRCIRSVNIDDDSTEWQSVVKIEEQSQEETYTVLNAPTCSALSPEGDMIAFGYRGHPVTVWDLGTEEQVGQCNMTPDETGVTTQTRTLGEITSLRWHPFNCEIFGLHREGLMFKWDPYDDEASATMHARAHFLAISADGSLVATGDTEGTLKVYTTADLTLVYQLSSQDHVLDIAFSADSKRLYDIRGDYGNVWEPNALVRLAESSEYSDHNTSDAWSENGSLAKLSLQTEHHFPGVDTIVSLCGQMSGPLYCYGTENGVAVLGEVGHGNVCEVERMANFMSIEQVSWSDDGQILAVADLSERISIKRISKTTSTEGQRPLRVHDEFKVAFPSTHRHINQLLFQPKTHNLLAISSIGLFNIDADTQKVEESSLPVEMADVKWISHPTQSEYLLAFGHSHVRIFSWSTLKEVATYHYSPPRLRRSTEVPENQHGRGSFRAGEEKLGRIVSCTDSPDVILEIALPTPSAQPERQYLIFTLSNTDGVSDEAVASSPEQQTKELCYTLVPPEIACRIREPLALISRGRFVFLDVDRWICTWRTPTAPRRSVGGRAGSEAGLVGPVDAHYFLPGDWVTAIEARLCTVAPDGTLLCPRNGDVASVQCAKLRK